MEQSISKPNRRSNTERIYIFISSLMLVMLQTIIYGYTWYHCYYGQPFLRVRYWNRGNIVYIGMFAVYVIIFGLIFKGFVVSYSSFGELFLSHLVMEIAVHLVSFVQLSFIVQRYWIRWKPLALCFLVNICISLLWCIVSKILYKNLFPPKDALIITMGRYKDSDLYSEPLDRTYTQYMVRETISPEDGWDSIKSTIQSGRFQTVVVDEMENEKLRNKIFKLCFELNRPCYVVPSVSDILLLGSKRITHFDTPLQYFNNSQNLSVEESVIKRIGDIIISVAILAITSPVFLLTIVAVLWDTGKVFARHEMLTKDGKKFNLIRFQVRNTDYERAWKSSAYLKQYSPIGAIINRLHIAGLPQLFNVIKGDISLVGPRPFTIQLTSKYYEEIGPEVLYRLRVKGGIFGNAQLNAKKGSTALDRLKMDLDYIENFSLRRDALILLRSIIFHK